MKKPAFREFRPWSSARLRKLASDLREVGALGEVGDDGRARFAAGIEYIEAMIEVRGREASKSERVRLQARYIRKVAGHAV